MTYNYEKPLLVSNDVKYTPDTLKDIQTLFEMCIPHSNNSNISFLNDFYKKQGEYYDNYRSRMLHGKGKLMTMIPYFENMKILLFAGGTGDLVEYLPPNLNAKVTCMDLCTPLLEIAKKRKIKMDCVLDNAHTYVLREQDVVICSYSLTMIPDWKAAIENIVQSCKIGGYVCITDFTVAGENIPRDMVVKYMFSNDNVNLNYDHINTLDNHPQLERLRMCIDEGGFPFTLEMYKSNYYYGVWQRIN
jgi:ubiquinone/menaquinone biosynthesis C-methylase UbiE